LSAVTTSTFLRVFGLSRVGFGLWLAIAPNRPGHLWFGSETHPPSTAVLLRSVGGRDVGLGLGLASDPRPGSIWLKVGILADLVDALAVLLVRDRVPARNLWTGFAGGLAYAVTGTVIALVAKDG
jgi:hypothetical protein